jgi:MFS family permease
MLKYFDGKINKGFLALLTSMSIMYIVSGLLGIFGPIFIYQILDENLQLLLLFVSITGFLFLPFVSIGMKFVNKVGFKRALQTSAFVGAFYYLLYFLVDKSFISVITFFALAIIVLPLYQVIYWVPYHTEYIRFSNKLNRGREVSLFLAIYMAIGIFLPIVAAFLIEDFGYNIVFILAIILYIASGIPFRHLSEGKQKFSWGIKKTLEEYFHHKNNKMAIAFMAQGGETVISLFLWPIFLYQVFDGNLLEVGFISAFIIVGTAILQLIVGGIIDKFKKGKGVLETGGFFYSLGWIFKVFVITSFDVFVVGVYHNISKIFTTTPMQSINYDLCSEQDDYIDEYNALREMYIKSGRAITALIAVGLSLFIAIKWLFIIGAILALVFHLVSEKDIHLKEQIKE